MSLSQDARTQANAQELDPGRLIGSPLACLEADGLLQRVELSSICSANYHLKAQQQARQYADGAQSLCGIFCCLINHSQSRQFQGAGC